VFRLAAFALRASARHGRHPSFVLEVSDDPPLYCLLERVAVLCFQRVAAISNRVSVIRILAVGGASAFAFIPFVETVRTVPW
jgi:hypothetical protein